MKASCIEVIEQVKLLAAVIDNYYKERAAVRDRVQEAITNARDQYEKRVSLIHTAYSQISSEQAIEEKARRVNADNAERELNACLRRLEAAIPDLLLQKVKEEYFKEAHESENHIIPSSLTAYETAQLIKTDLSDLNKEISAIADAFIPSSVSTFFGIYIPASLERRCRRIGELAEQIRVHIGYLRNQEDIKERAAYALSVREQDISNADNEHHACSLGIHLKFKKMLVFLWAWFVSDLWEFWFC